jgi:hypothetical protein
VALSQARILYQNHSGDYPQVILTIPVTCRTMGNRFTTDDTRLESQTESIPGLPNSRPAR